MVTQVKLSELTEAQARQWLIVNDAEAADMWRSLANDVGLVAAVKDNLNGHGYESQSGEIIIIDESIVPASIPTAVITISPTHYPALFAPQPEGGYVVTFRDIPEAITQGKNLKEAVEMAEDALDTAFEFYFELLKPIPEPSEIRLGEKLIRLYPRTIPRVAFHNTTWKRYKEANLDGDQHSAWLGRMHYHDLAHYVKEVGKSLVIAVVDSIPTAYPIRITALPNSEAGKHGMFIDFPENSFDYEINGESKETSLQGLLHFIIRSHIRDKKLVPPPSTAREDDDILYVPVDPELLVKIKLSNIILENATVNHHHPNQILAMTTTEAQKSYGYWAKAKSEQ